MHFAADHNNTFTPFTQFKCHFPEFISTRKNHQIGTKGNKSVGSCIFHICHIVGSIFCAKPFTDRLSRLWIKYQPRGFWFRNMARLRIIDGQSDFLHNFQQSISASIQKRLAVSIQKQNHLASGSDESSVAAIKKFLTLHQEYTSHHHRQQFKQLFAYRNENREYLPQYCKLEKVLMTWIFYHCFHRVNSK